MKRVATFDRKCFTIDEYAPDTHNDVLDVQGIMVLTMEDSKRMPNVWVQLAKCCPAQRVFIFTNAGYKVCSKTLCVQRTDYDLLHAYKTMFEFALAQELTSVLTFEDDFFWSSAVETPCHFQRIRRFLDDHQHTMDHYFLGFVPLLTIPFGHHWRLYSAGGTHAVVHTERGMHTYLREYKLLCERCAESQSCTIDLYFTSFAIVYGYWRPLAYQLFPKTQMQKEAWPPLCATLMNTFTNLDRRVHPWYDVFYVLQCVPIILVLIIVVLTLRLCRRRLSQ